MVTVINKRDLGGELGQAFSGGMQKMADVGMQRQMQQKGLDVLKDTLQEKYMEKIPLVDPKTGENMLGEEGDVQYQMDKSGSPMFRQKEGADPLMMGLELLRGAAGQPALQQSISEHIIPLMMKRVTSQGAAAGAFGGQPGGQPGGQVTDKVEITQENLGPQIEQSIEKAGIQRAQYDVIPDDQQAFVPSFKDAPPAYDTLSLEEANSIAADMASQNATPAQIYQAIDQRVQNSLRGYKSKREGWEQNLKQFSAARGLESEQRDFLSGPDQAGGRVGSWLAESKIEPSTQFWHDVGYDIFQKERQKNPVLSDQQLWSKSKKSLENLKNLQAKANMGMAKPSLGKTVFGKSGVDAVQSGKNYAQQLYDIAGKNPTTIDKAKTTLTENGWDEDYAIMMSQPPGKNLESWFDKAPKLPPSSMAQSEAQSAQIEKKRSQGIQRAMGNPPPLGPDDSVKLLRNRLVRDHKFNKFEANEYINYLKEQGKLSEMQITEMSELTDEVKLLPLWNIFHHGTFR